MNQEELDKFIADYGLEEMYQASFVLIRTLVYCVLVGCVLALLSPFINLFVRWWNI